LPTVPVFHFARNPITELADLALNGYNGNGLAAARSIAKFNLSAITAEPHDPVDLRSVGNPDISERPVIQFRQGVDRLSDLSLTAPALPNPKFR
jgi:hypothetical protein